MPLESKFIKLDPADVSSNTNMIYYDNYNRFMATQFKASPTNSVTTVSSGADSVIGMGALKNDSDLVITSSWVDGFSVHRLNDDGTLSLLYHDGSPYGSEDSYQSLALDKPRSIAYVANHYNDTITYYDYSDCKGGMDTVTKLGALTEAGNDLPSDEVGYSYFSGLEIAGDYLYIGPDDHWRYDVSRWNTQTQTQELLPVINIGNDALRGHPVYFPGTDRMYIQWVYDASAWVILDASTASPSAYNIRLNNIGMGDDTRTWGVVETSDPNIIWIGCEYRMAKVDITPCITDPVADGTTPTLLTNKPYLRDIPYWLNCYQRFSAPHPTYGSDFLVMYADRGWCEMMGWYDQEHDMPVVCPQENNYSYGKAPMRFDYQPAPILVTTDNGTKYWVYAGYGNNEGHEFNVHSESNGVLLEGSSSIVFGTYSLDNSANVGSIKVRGPSLRVPSGCTASFYVSNDNGNTWESISYNDSTSYGFSSTGNQIKVKINFTGTPIKSPHIVGSESFEIAIIEDNIFSDSAKESSFKIGGNT